MRRFRFLLLLWAAALAGSARVAGSTTCDHAYVAEGGTPSAVTGMNTTDTGFTTYYWAWGSNGSDQGSTLAGLLDDDEGVAISPGILWANSDACGGTFAGTGLLLETQTVASGGSFALVAVQGAEVHLDLIQSGSLQSSAAAIPAPTRGGSTTGLDQYGAYLDVDLTWEPPVATAWALSNLSPVHVGYALYFVTAAAGGPVNTGARALFTRVGATASESAPYVTDDDGTDDGYLPATQLACTVRIRDGAVYYFALALRFDGSGAPGPEAQADASAVETAYVSSCSAGATTAEVLFADGFETGTTSRWSVAAP
jgi:hypothetical protein